MIFLFKTQVNEVHVLQNIFVEYKQPFAVTYLGVSLMVIFLPIAILKDWICRLLDTSSLKKIYSGSSLLSSSVGLTVPLWVNELHHCTDEALELIADMDLETEHGWPLINTNHDDEFYMLESRELNSWEIAKCSLYLAPIWFLTEVTTSALVDFSL